MSETTPLLSSSIAGPSGSNEQNELESAVPKAPYSRKLLIFSWFTVANTVLTVVFNLSLGLVIILSRCSNQLNQQTRESVNTTLTLSTVHAFGIVLNSTRFYTHHQGFWHLLRLIIDALIGIYSIGISTTGLDAIKSGTGCSISQNSESDCEVFADKIGIPIRFGLAFGIIVGITHLGFFLRSCGVIAGGLKSSGLRNISNIL